MMIHEGDLTAHIHASLQADFNAFRQTSEQMLEAKDFQLQQSLETNAELRSQCSTLRHELVSINQELAVRR